MRVYESAEDYLEAILVIGQRRGAVRSIDVANELGFSKPSVSRAMKLLREDGALTVDEGGAIELTAQGRAAAEQVCERAALAVELAGGDLKEEERECFYRALESITGRLREISREGLPKRP